MRRAVLSKRLPTSVWSGKAASQGWRVHQRHGSSNRRREVRCLAPCRISRRDIRDGLTAARLRDASTRPIPGPGSNGAVPMAWPRPPSHLARSDRLPPDQSPLAGRILSGAVRTQIDLQ